MSTAISVLGGVGLFLLGMTIMTDGLKGLAGSSLRAVLAKAAATPWSGALWGALVTLLVQSSSATTMTTIGLVSAGLLTFPQGLGLVFGANIGTTGTGWLVALIGVRVSLSSFALPLIFVGAMGRLMGKGRIAASGAALAGFALVLYGLTTLQQGMGGLSEQLRPSDLPAVLGMDGVSGAPGWIGLLSLVAIGAVMTTVMQSSTAAIAVTLSAFHAGAIGLEQGLALVIGQNIGTATSSAMAALGASVTAKRLALAYILFKLIAATIFILSFPLVAPAFTRFSAAIDGVTLLAAFHTLYNVVGVAALMPIIGLFTRLVEKLLPDSGAPLARALDPAALENPVVAIEAARRTLARIIAEAGPKIAAAAGAADSSGSLSEASEALGKTREFLSELGETPATMSEDLRLGATLRALDRLGRLVEAVGEAPEFPLVQEGDEERAAGAHCAGAMRAAAEAVGDILGESAFGAKAAALQRLETPLAAAALDQLKASAGALAELRKKHREATLAAAAGGALGVEQAMGRIETVRRLEQATRHMARAVADLLGETTAPGESSPAAIR